MRRLGDAIGGAAKAAILWFILSAWTIATGFQFAHQTWWWGTSYCLVAAIGAVRGVLSRSRERRQIMEHSVGAAGIAADLGLAYLPTVERPPVPLPCFEKWHDGKEGNVGEIGRTPVSMFDMTELLEDSEGPSYCTRTIVLLPADGLPAFTASQRGAGRFAHIFGLGGMTFDSAAAPFGEADTVRQFGRSLRIELPGNPGPWTPATPELRTAEESVRRLVTPGFMAHLLGRPGWSFQTGAGWLACWRGKAVCPAGERPQWIAAAAAIQAALLAAAADTSPVVLPPVRLPNGAQFIARALGMIAGLLLLGYGAFFFAIFGIIPRHQSTGLLNILLILPFPIAAVGAVAGGALGYWVGAALGRVPGIARWTPPPQPTPDQKAEKDRRDSWRRGFGCLGVCLGFPAGMAALDILSTLIWSDDQAPVWRGALMLTLPVGGAIAGLIGAAALGGWVAGQRAKSLSRRGIDMDEPHQVEPPYSPDSRRAT